MEKEMTMVERCAKAIYAKLNDEMRGDGYLSDISDDMTDVVVDGRVDLLAVARAAIEGMREPTQQMRLAGIAEWSRPDPTPEHESTLVFNAVWRAMVNAALKEQEGEKR